MGHQSRVADACGDHARRWKKATVGNGVMVALDVRTPDAVKKVHAKAMQLGGKDEGQPGPRGTGGFHGGYFRDLDGNKLVAFCMAQ
jgi:predicted lactoylglutathione lyase